VFVGSLRVRLLIREARSLKDKRQVVRSIQDRLRNRFQVSVAEVDAQDQHQVAVLGIAAVGAAAGGVRSILEEIAAGLRAHPVAELLQSELMVFRPEDGRPMDA
jgi:uncharacterized protein YlxP (DUF503 family)